MRLNASAPSWLSVATLEGTDAQYMQPRLAASLGCIDGLLHLRETVHVYFEHREQGHEVGASSFLQGGIWRSPIVRTSGAILNKGNFKTMAELQPYLEQRYGTDAPTVPGEANPVIEAILRHKSVRHFRDAPLPEGTLEQIVAAAQSAASSSNLQTWTVIALQDPAHKAQAATLCGDQDFIRKAPLFLVFCADLNRLTTLSEQQELPGEGLDYFEMFLMATIDASLAAQNAALAAESLGLGICYVGAVRNKPRELSTLLQLPPRVFALFGMAIGVPESTDTSAVKPRLPQPEVLHREIYHAEERAHWINRYNTTMARFYVSQHMNVQGDWARHSAKRVATVQSLTGRHILREFLHERGFSLK